MRGFVVADQNASTVSWPLAGLGVLLAGAGIYFGLVGLELAPPPSRINGPIWLSLFIGVVFFSAGIALIVSGATGAYDRAGELPAETPAWIAAIYSLSGLLMVCGLAAIGTWVAFGGGERNFSVNGCFSGPVGDGIGRTAFGIGALISWFIVAVMARAAAKKIFSK